MTPEQLAAARTAHWRQSDQPVLTLDDATAWMNAMQLALFLPRRQHVLAPAPSFVEAVLGKSSSTPSPEAIERSFALLTRLVAEGKVVPLNLFGTPGEQPDFLATVEALPFVAAMQGERNWKKAPPRTGAGKVSPLATEVWKVLDRSGALTANEIRGKVGSEITEAATLRALSELWQILRVAPLPSDDGAHWQLLTVTHRKEMTVASTMAQSAALSMLVANYLQAVITATAEDVESFLSPLASRSRLRDVVRGLSTTRQLKTMSLDAQTYIFVDGTLPEMPDLPAATGEGIAEAPPSILGRSAYRERMQAKSREGETDAPVPNPRRERRPSEVQTRDPRPAQRPSFGQRFAAGGSSAPRRDGERIRGRSDASRPRRDSGTREGGDVTGGRFDHANRAHSNRDRPARPFRPADRSRSDGGATPFRPRPRRDDRSGRSASPPSSFPQRSAPRSRDGEGTERRTGSGFRPRSATGPGERRPWKDRPGGKEARSSDRPQDRPSRPFSRKPEGERDRRGRSAPSRNDNGAYQKSGQDTRGEKRPFKSGPAKSYERRELAPGRSDRPPASKGFRPRDNQSVDARDARSPFHDRSDRVRKPGGDRPRENRATGGDLRRDSHTPGGNGTRRPGSFSGRASDRPRGESRPTGGAPRSGAPARSQYGNRSATGVKRQDPRSIRPSGQPTGSRPDRRPGRDSASDSSRPSRPNFQGTTSGGARRDGAKTGGARPDRGAGSSKGPRAGNRLNRGNGRPRSGSRPAGGMRPPARKPRQEPESK